MMAKFHADTHRFEHGDGLSAEIIANHTWRVIEVATRINWHRLNAFFGLVLEQEEFNFRMGIEGISLIGCSL